MFNNLVEHPRGRYAPRSRAVEFNRQNRSKGPLESGGGTGAKGGVGRRGERGGLGGRGRWRRGREGRGVRLAKNYSSSLG